MSSVNHLSYHLNTSPILQFNPAYKSANNKDNSSPPNQISGKSGQILSLSKNSFQKSTTENSSASSEVKSPTNHTIKSTGTKSNKLSYLKEYLNNHEKKLSKKSKGDLENIGKETETSLESSSRGNLKIHVDGIPSTGAKSRVETQIKLSIRLLDDSGSKVSNWSYLRIDNSQLARSKFRKFQNQKNSDECFVTMSSDEPKVLRLEAQVICESNENKIIKMCQGCVRRERKRSERKKNVKPLFNNTPVSNDLSAGDETFERDRLRVLLFNSEPLVNFSSGTAIIPTRITCYCRHHNERIGFRIRFAMRNSNGVIVAKGQSPVIMITDDHKSSKQRVLDRKKHVSKYDTVFKDEITPDVHASQTDSYFGNFTPDVTPYSSHCEESLGYFSHPRPQSASSISSSSVFQNFASPLLTPSENSVYIGTPNLYTPPYFVQDMAVQYQETQYASVDTLQMSHQQNSVATDMSLSTVHTDFENINSNSYTNSSCRNTIPNLALSHNSINQGSLVNSYFQAVSKHALVANSLYDPEIQMISPSQGPVYGGTEITITGNGFHADLNVMFGGRAATTICWSPTSIVCILPPTENAGQVLVSFKGQTTLKHENYLFNYYENGRQEILNLSLQAVQNKDGTNLRENTVFIPNGSSNVAYHQGIHNNNNNLQSQHQQQFEQDILNILSHVYDTSNLERTNISGQNILHIASYSNYISLVTYIIARHPALIDTQDINGFSPLHFACQSKATDVIQILLNSGANILLESYFGAPADLVYEQQIYNSADEKVQEMFMLTPCHQQKDVIMMESSNECFENPLMIHYLDNLLYTL